MVSAALWLSPAARLATGSAHRPSMWAGARLSAKSPRPSCPEELHPHENTCKSSSPYPSGACKWGSLKLVQISSLFFIPCQCIGNSRKFG